MSVEIDNLKDVKKVLDELGIVFWLEAGTLLLAYRDGAEDKSDSDISVYSTDEVLPHLDKFKELGFNIYRIYRHPSGLATEITLERKGARLDIWPKLLRDGRAWWLSFGGPHEFIPHHVDERYVKTLDKFTIWDTEWNIPHDVENFLTDVYGDWRTPDPNWSWWRDPKCIDYSWEVR